MLYNYCIINTINNSNNNLKIGIGIIRNNCFNGPFKSQEIMNISANIHELDNETYVDKYSTAIEYAI